MVTAELVDNGRCVTVAELTGPATAAFASMHVNAPTATLQSASNGLGALLLNVWYPVFVDDTPVSAMVNLLGVPVEIQAVPRQWVWDFDDPFSPEGGPSTTSFAGIAWREGTPGPDERWLAHQYTRLGDPDTAAGRWAGTHRNPDNGLKFRTDVTVSAHTTWVGRFRIAGRATWTTVTGTLTTLSEAGTFVVTEAKARLVCDDLLGNHYC
jgi:hypothetical protein